MKKSYIKTSIITASIFLALVLTIFTLISFFSPLTMASFYSNLGLNTLSYNCYNLAYKNSDKLEEQHYMFSSSVYKNDYNDTIYYSSKMLLSNGYLAYINEVDSANITRTSDKAIEIKISVASEDNYIKNKYVLSLIKKDRIIEAKELALNDLSAYIKGNNLKTFSRQTSFLYKTIYDAGISLSNSELTDILDFYKKLDAAEKKVLVQNSTKLERAALNFRAAEVAYVLGKSGIPYPDSDKGTSDFLEIMALHANKIVSL